MQVANQVEWNIHPDDELLPDAAQLKALAALEGLVFDYHPQLHKVPWEVANRIKNKHALQALKKQPFKQARKSLGKGLTQAITKITSRDTVDAWEGGQLTQTPRQVWDKKNMVTSFQTWVWYRITVNQLNLRHGSERIAGYEDEVSESNRHIFWECPRASSIWLKMVSHGTGYSITKTDLRKFLGNISTQRAHQPPNAYRTISNKSSGGGTRNWPDTIAKFERISAAGTHAARSRFSAAHESLPTVYPLDPRVPTRSQLLRTSAVAKSRVVHSVFWGKRELQVRARSAPGTGMDPVRLGYAPGVLPPGHVGSGAWSSSLWPEQRRSQRLRDVPERGETGVILIPDMTDAEMVSYGRSQFERWMSVPPDVVLQVDIAYMPRHNGYDLWDFIRAAGTTARHWMSVARLPSGRWLNVFRGERRRIPVLSDLRAVKVSLKLMPPVVCVAVFQTMLWEAGFEFLNRVPVWPSLVNVAGVPDSQIRTEIERIGHFIGIDLAAWNAAVGSTPYFVRRIADLLLLESTSLTWWPRMHAWPLRLGAEIALLDSKLEGRVSEYDDVVVSAFANKPTPASSECMIIDFITANSHFQGYWPRLQQLLEYRLIGVDVPSDLRTRIELQVRDLDDDHCDPYEPSGDRGMTPASAPMRSGQAAQALSSLPLAVSPPPSSSSSSYSGHARRS
ncbi:hypothetical protein ON010_g14351 [Phytophthora cinnamomi]|nr:hypothetical protein ON010_g14351 [Phytophthora cinnamomi]